MRNVSKPKGKHNDAGAKAPASAESAAPSAAHPSQDARRVLVFERLDDFIEQLKAEKKLPPVYIAATASPTVRPLGCKHDQVCIELSARTGHLVSYVEETPFTQIEATVQRARVQQGICERLDEIAAQMQRHGIEWKPGRWVEMAD